MTAFLNMFKLIVSLLPAVVSAIQQVEFLFPGSGLGKDKLELVKNLASDAYNSSGKLEATIAEVIKVIEVIATRVVATSNAIGIFKKGV